MHNSASGPDEATRPFDLLVIGDANPDLILHGGTLEPEFGQREALVGESHLVLGGSGAITAVGASRLGLRTAMAAAVGDDVFGRFMLDQLRAEGVDTGAMAVRSDLPTGVSVALARPDDRAILTARGAMAALDPGAINDTVLRSARHVHIASPFLQPLLRDGLERLVDRVHAAGATVSVDPGWDPEERWTPVAQAIGNLDLFLPNGQEAVHLARAATHALRPSSDGGGPAPADGVIDEELAAAHLLSTAGPLVIMKMGARGAAAVQGGQPPVVVDARPVEPLDATGAGDSFDAGFLTAWLDGLELQAAVRLGCACGALSTRGAGGTAAQPSRSEAEALVEA